MPRTLLSAHDLVRAFGTRTVLTDVSLTVDDRSRIALVGRNGSGKSTLLRLLAGAEPPDGGRVVRAHDVAVLHLPQLDVADDRRAVRELLHERLGVAAAAARMDSLAAELVDGRDVVEEHAAALQRWLDRGGADLDARLDRAAADAGLEAALLDRPAAALSGGQRARAMLAAITAARGDVLLLDEPANHLDADGLARLRALLLARPGGLVLVAHDRALLAAVCTHVVAIDAHTGAATTWSGGWEAYEAEWARTRRRAVEDHERALAERRRLHERERAVRARSAQGQRRSLAENDRNLRHLYRESAQNGSGALAAQLARRAERIEVPDRPWQDKPSRLPFTAPAGGHGVVAALHGAVLRRGAFGIGPIELEVRDGERILLAGPNGCGKSTVLAALAGRLLPERGRAHRPGTAGSSVIAEVAQARSLLLRADVPDLVAAVRAHAGLDERAARAALAAMGLGQELAVRPVASLSPGERTRAELAAVTAAGARLLLLDEPTNHLDTEALEALEAALERWPGALVVATHDERLRAGLRLDQTIDVAGLRRPPAARPAAPSTPR
jgi:ATPase subunit of ABC transporter with duplicated ATPase domains